MSLSPKALEALRAFRPIQGLSALATAAMTTARDIDPSNRGDIRRALSTTLNQRCKHVRMYGRLSKKTYNELADYVGAPHYGCETRRKPRRCPHCGEVLGK